MNSFRNHWILFSSEQFNYTLILIDYVFVLYDIIFKQQFVVSRLPRFGSRNCVASKSGVFIRWTWTFFECINSGEQTNDPKTEAWQLIEWLSNSNGRCRRQMMRSTKTLKLTIQIVRSIEWTFFICSIQTFYVDLNCRCRIKFVRSNLCSLIFSISFHFR